MEFDLDWARALLEQAKSLGATEGDVMVLTKEAFSVQVRLGEIEKISGTKEKSLGLRLFVGTRSAITSTSDFAPASLRQLVTDTYKLATLAEEDTAAGLPAYESCAKTYPDLALTDAEIEKLSVDQKIDMAKRAEEVALSQDARLTQSDGADFSHSDTQILYAASNGFNGQFRASGVSLSVSPIALSKEGRMQRDYWYCARRRLNQMETAEAVGRVAAARTVRRIGARKIATQQVPVIFDPETAASLMGHLASAVSGDAIYKGASFLIGQMGQQIASPLVTVYDDPTLPGALGSQPFDDEGLPSYRKEVIKNGILKSYLLDTYSGRKLGLPSTGNASRSTGVAPSVGTTNFHLAVGDTSPSAIIGSVKSGLYVTELIGFGVNGVTGDYSRGAVGLWIENGELTYPVHEITIAGNLKDMYRQIEKVGNDLDPLRRTAAPTLKIAQMTIAGN